ncbi:Maf family protein [Candidatus Latescibacterota bacterium]
MSELILASRSPRRREILKLLGHPFTCMEPTVDEDIINGETPSQHVLRLSELKALNVGSQRNNGIIIGSDTIVVIDDEIFGKPCSSEEAIEMLMRLQGQTHTVYTGFALYNAATGKIFSSYEATDVTMRSITYDMARRYVGTGEPLDKAGAYGIQGYGSALITSIHGCFFNVMGLPLARLMETLDKFDNREFGFFGVRRNHPDISTEEQQT